MYKAKILIVSALVLLLGACASVQQGWLGTWTGPEGTYLKLESKGEDYLIRIRDLDGETSYTGQAKGDKILFVRNGQSESLHSGNGQDTGMKWLSDKQTCLIVRVGEGYCR